MSAGKKRHRVRFELNTPTKAADGQRKAGWNPIATAPEMWAEKEALGAREGFDAAAIVTQRPHRWKVRFREDLSTKNRLVDVRTGEAHDIESVEDLEGRRKELVIMTVVTDGA